MPVSRASRGQSASRVFSFFVCKQTKRPVEYGFALNDRGPKAIDLRFFLTVTRGKPQPPTRDPASRFAARTPG